MSTATSKTVPATGQGNLLRWLILGVGAVGVGVRLAAYAANRSFWCDESMLAFNILDRSWKGLLEPLSLSQTAPLGFLAVSKALSDLLGGNEYAFRFFPLLAGLVSLPLIYRLGKIAAGRWTGLLALCLLAVNGPAVFHATEFKPYSTDLTLALSVGLVFLEWYRREMTVRFLWWIAPLAAMSVWLSFPAIFMITGSATALILLAARQGQWRRVLAGGEVLLWTAAHFVLHYWLVLPRTEDSAYLRQYWDGAFMPLDSPAGLATWLWSAGRDLFTENLLLAWPLIPAALAVAGLWWFRRQCPPLALLSGITLLLTLGASALQRYPFGGYGGRTIHFLIPLVMVLLAGAVTRIVEFSGSINGRVLVIVALLAVLLWRPLAQLPAYMTAPPGFTEELRPVLEFVTSEARPGDTVYFYWKTHFQMAYYHYRFDFRSVRVIRGAPWRHAEQDADAFRQQLDELSTHHRVWLIFSNWGRAENPEQEMVMDYLRRRGDVVRQAEHTGAAACLFVFPAPREHPGPVAGGDHE